MKKNTRTFDITLTDTFGGVPNYSEVTREEITVDLYMHDSWIVRHAKRAVGMSGVRGITVAGPTWGYGSDVIEIRFPSRRKVLFITQRFEKEAA